MYFSNCEEDSALADSPTLQNVIDIILDWQFNQDVTRKQAAIEEGAIVC